ncbi:phosphonopyruvate hydrolase [Rhizobium azibense]|uniref:Phosphoenolpyruvate phosphomutase n=1 Tax=Rhizobium azibense TaxID=1136135 RepID=A0A4R3RF31_9HYPH|nr:phosphonopyruvate hydrolase [Rhizobium azibense]TCU32829.1 phosphoenolpyruvate phosphomutase [Rhizobium azibense]
MSLISDFSHTSRSSKRKVPTAAGILRARIAEQGLVHVMAAHSPLSAILVEEAGFDGIWASGFELSALYGLPDVSLVSMTQHLDMVRAMAEQSSLPIVADIDTGFGNAVNVIHAVRQYERAGAAAVVIEDKTFPKVTSLAPEGRQELVRIEEFVGKIRAAIASRRNPDFLVIARTEALIAGSGEPEALMRAAAYEEAGADMILIHSKQDTPDEVESFLNGWSGRAPIVIVPTTYPQMNEQRIRALSKIGMVIYGNHAIRATVTAMKDVFVRVRKDGGIHHVNRDLVSVEEIFRLQRMDRVRDDEKKFLT